MNALKLFNRLAVVSSKLSLISGHLPTQCVKAERRFETLFKGIIIFAT